MRPPNGPLLIFIVKFLQEFLVPEVNPILSIPFAFAFFVISFSLCLGCGEDEDGCEKPRDCVCSYHLEVQQ